MLRESNLDCITLSRLEVNLQQTGLAKEIRCNTMGDVGYRFGWLKSGGKGSQTRKLLSIMSSAAPDTPDVAASGATTQWANGPTAPPTYVSIVKQLRKDLGLTIGAVDMATMHVGSLNKIKRLRNEYAVRPDRK